MQTKLCIIMNESIYLSIYPSNKNSENNFNDYYFFQVMTYVAEITQPHLRGMFSTLTSLTIFSGILLEFILGTFLPWRNLVLVNAVIPVLSFILLFFVPETPIWLMMKNRPQEAAESLAWLRGWTTPEKVEREFLELWTKIEVENKQQNEPKTLFDLISFLGKKEIYTPMGLVVFTYIVSQFSGTHTLTTYAVPIFNSLNSPIDGYYATIILGFMQLLGCLFSMFLIKILGKRVLTLVSLVGICLTFLIVAVHAYINNNLYLEQDYGLKDSETHWIPLIFLPLASFSAHLGITIIPWILIGEVFPNENRAKAAGITGALGYIISSVSRKIFPNLVKLIYLPGILLFFSLVALFGIVILYFILPETEGKTLYEISDHFSGKVKMDNKVKRKTEEIEMEKCNEEVEGELKNSVKN